MKTKLFCPHCGRCLGECFGSDDSSECRVLVNRPAHPKKRYFLHNMKCLKCKNEVFIVMDFKDLN